jgi:predicted TIM-barrel fold metal-dependent hydrolase
MPMERETLSPNTQDCFICRLNRGKEGEIMVNSYPMKIDIYSHILPRKYIDFVTKIMPSDSYWRIMIQATPTLCDLEHRFRIIDKYGVMQVLVLCSPGIEEIANPKKAVDVARLANDEMAELVHKYPDRFPAAIASLPLNNMDAALKEADRAINDLLFRGVQIFTPINDKPIDSEEFLPLYEKMSQQYNLPILIHPRRQANYPDYRSETESKYNIWQAFGWPYETTAAMTRLVFSGVFEKYPNLKIITHHCGAMVPYFAQRIVGQYNIVEMRRGAKHKQGLTRPPIEYFKMFYNDTALCGHTPGLMCGYHFFGADHILFGTDMPMDSQLGECNTRDTIDAIEQMDIDDMEKCKIFSDNARNLFRLPI